MKLDVREHRKCTQQSLTDAQTHTEREWNGNEGNVKEARENSAKLKENSREVILTEKEREGICARTCVRVCSH